MKWKQALEDYEHYLKLERGLSENSIKNYILDVTKLIGFIESNELNLNPLQINKETIKRFVYEIATSVNPRSQARIISGLKSFFNYLNLRTTVPTTLWICSNRLKSEENCQTRFL